MSFARKIKRQQGNPRQIIISTMLSMYKGKKVVQVPEEAYTKFFSHIPAVTYQGSAYLLMPR